MSDSEAVPSEWKAFRGRSFAVGATRWMMPITIVPCPNAAYGVPSSTAAVDWSSTAAVDWFTFAGEQLGQGGGGHPEVNGHGEEEISFNSEPPGWFRVKSKPCSRTPCSAGWVGSTPVSISATIPVPNTLNVFCVSWTPTIDAAG